MHKLFFHVGSKWEYRGTTLTITAQFRSRYNPPNMICAKDNKGDSFAFKDIDTIDAKHLGGDHKGFWVGELNGDLLSGSNTKTEIIRRMIISGSDFARQIDMLGGRETVIDIKDQYGDFIEAIVGTQVYRSIPLKITDIDHAADRWRSGCNILIPKSETTIEPLFLDDHDVVLRLLSGENTEHHPHYIKARGAA